MPASRHQDADADTRSVVRWADAGDRHGHILRHPRRRVVPPGAHRRLRCARITIDPPRPGARRRRPIRRPHHDERSASSPVSGTVWPPGDRPSCCAAALPRPPTSTPAVIEAHLSSVPLISARPTDHPSSGRSARGRRSTRPNSTATALAGSSSRGCSTAIHGTHLGVRWLDVPWPRPRGGRAARGRSIDLASGIRWPAAPASCHLVVRRSRLPPQSTPRPRSPSVLRPAPMRCGGPPKMIRTIDPGRGES